ncbi:MAG TPA: serine/threonine-protein kinase [Gemmatimonadales bacterium]|nr:serine/threonine-protein kinase [Gemmatimonadales bacterium]
MDREAGAGGMATVYLAEDLRHHRKVAVKVLKSDLAASMGADRFLREIGIAAALQHPHILPLYDSGSAIGPDQSSPYLFYVMPFIEGASLRDRIAREGALPVPDAVRILRDVADALAEAHRHGVVHRDIKPENVMLSGRHALVTDFGVAKAVSDSADASNLTGTGMALGTPAYMAPEQATADPTMDHRADLYAFGVLAYELLAGRPPFQHATMQGLIAAHVTTAPERLSVHRASVPPALEALVMRCLEKRAADRWQSAEEIVAQLENLPISGANTPTAMAPATPAARNPLRGPGVLAAAVLLPLLAALAWFTTRGGADAALDENLVLALPFRVTATAPEVLNLREGIVDILQASMGGSTGPRVVAAQTAIGAWRRAGGGAETDLADTDAAELAQELGAGSVLTGSIVQQGAGFVMSGSLTPVAGGRTLQGRVEGPVDSTLALVGRLVGQLLSLQAGEEAGRASSLAGVPLPALQAYLDGQRGWRAGRWAEAYDGFARALAADSTFALAGLYHSLAAGWNLGSPPSPGPDIARANLHRLSERDRILASVILNLPGDSTTAGRVASREQAAAALSDRAEAWYLLGDHIYHYGQLAGMSWPEQDERTWAAFNRGLALDPGFGPILTHAVDRHMFPTVDSAAFRRAQAEHPSVGQEGFLTGLAAYAFGDTAEIRRIEDTGGAAQLFGLSGFAAMFGQNDGAIRLLRLRVQRATSSQERTSSLEQARDLAWAGGRPQLAARMASELGVQQGPLTLEDHRKQVVAALLYDADSVPAAASIAALESRIRDVGTGPPDFAAIYAAWHVGIWRASEGNTAQALELTRQLRLWVERSQGWVSRSAARIGADLIELVATSEPSERRRRALALDDVMRSGPLSSATPSNLANLLVARALGEAGEHSRAAAASRRSNFFDGLLPARLSEERGRQALLAGDTTTAIQEWQLYLRSRAQAEPAQRAKDDLIRQELARLVGEPRGQ